MRAEVDLQITHPEGESENTAEITPQRWPLDTPGGRVYAEWNDDLPVTREGQLIFFFQFLNAGGRWSEFLADTPLQYQGNQGSGAHNVFGTLLLSVLRGHSRYAHINSVRGDGVNPSLLGMDKVVSEDTVRRGLLRIVNDEDDKKTEDEKDENKGLDWLERHLVDSISPALILPWILDIDTTVKPIYGHQEGATVGYNPQKPGRPSHSYHSYFVGNLRLALGVDIYPGNESASANGLPGMWRMLDRLPRERWPTFVRGDCGYGSERVMVECEERQLPYLFKLRRTAKVKNLVQTCLANSDGGIDTGDGWQAMEASLKLSGWTRKRRVVVVREAPGSAPPKVKAEADAVADESIPVKPKRGKKCKDQAPMLPGEDWQQEASPWSGKIAVLVTSLDTEYYPTVSMPRLYRERADMENNYDELKNQWGWCGFTTKKLEVCQLAATFIALVYNWWGLYVRFYDSEHHREAVTTRPYLMEGVGRQVQSGGQRTVKISLTHEKGADVAEAVSLISRRLHEFMTIAEQWTIYQRWAYLLTCVLRPWLGGKWLTGVPPDHQIHLTS